MLRKKWRKIRSLLWSEVRPSSAVARDLSMKSLTIAGFSLTSLTFVLSFYRNDLSRAIPLINSLLLSMIILFCSSEIIRTPTKLWHVLVGEIFYHFGILCLVIGFFYFAYIEISPTEFSSLLLIGYVMILIIFLSDICYSIRLILKLPGD